MTATKNKGNRLSIQLSLDGFSFLVFAPHKLKVEAEKKVTFPQKDCYKDWLKVKLAATVEFQQKYTVTNLLYTPLKTTIVPTELIATNTLENLFEISFPLEKNEMLLSENIGTETLLYSIPKDIHNLVMDYFPSAKWNSPYSFLLKKFQNIKKWYISTLVFENQIYIICLENKELKFCNSFTFQTKDDLLYYMLYIFDHFEIPVDESSIQLWGNYHYLELLEKELKPYHNTVQIARKAYGTKTNTSIGNLLLSNI